MSSSREYIKRLESLNGGPLRYQQKEKADVEEVRRKLETRRAAQPRPAPEPILYRRDLPRTTAKMPFTAPGEVTVVLEKAVAGEERVVGTYGQAYCIESALGTLGGAWDHVCDAFLDEFSATESPVQRYLAATCAAGPFLPEDVLFIDIESTGLGHSPLFLIGTLAWEDDDLLVRQYLARDYAEERAATALFIDAAVEKRLLVSFNGKSFDWPFIRARAAYNGLPFTLAPAHFDLLHTARRLWRGTLPNCKLQTLEHHICGRLRHDDIPGAEIPDAYHAYVRTGNASQLVQILKHNMLDLITLAELTTRLP